MKLAPFLLFAALSAQGAGVTITDGVTTQECVQVVVTKLDCTARPTAPSPAVGAALSALSTRGYVGAGDAVMIGGFTLSGARTVLVLARGPSLTSAGVAGALANPVLQLVAGSTLIGINDNWQTAANSAAVIATGRSPRSSAEAAILIPLDPGTYTAIVSGAAGGAGIAILEVFLQ